MRDRAWTEINDVWIAQEEEEKAKVAKAAMQRLVQAEVAAPVFLRGGPELLKEDYREIVLLPAANGQRARLPTSPKSPPTPRFGHSHRGFATSYINLSSTGYSVLSVPTQYLVLWLLLSAAASNRSSTSFAVLYNTRF